MISPLFKIDKIKGIVHYRFTIEQLKGYLHSLANGKYELFVRRRKRIRSLQQNRYYFGVVVRILADEWGWRPKELHNALKMKFLLIVSDDDKPNRIGSTTDLDTIGFEEYLEKIRTWAREDYNIIIPLPNEIELPEQVYSEI